MTARRHVRNPLPCSRRQRRPALRRLLPLRISLSLIHICYTTAIRKFFRESPAVYDPRKYLTLARDAFQKEVQHKMRNVVNSAGRY